jgi:hypothetical protein
MLKALAYAQQTAANVSGGVSFRGFHNPATGFPVGADTGYQYKLTGPGTLTFEVDGAKAVTAGDYIIKTATGWVHLDDATDAVKITRKVNGKALNADITLSAADVGAVPATRKVNNKVLSGDITLSAADVGAAAADDARLVNSREWLAATATKDEAEAGTLTDRRAFTPERVAQAIAAQAAPKAQTESRLSALEQGGGLRKLRLNELLEDNIFII